MRLTLIPDNSPLTQTPQGGTLGISDMGAAKYQLRLAFGDHRSIAALPEWEVCGLGVSENDVKDIENTLVSYLSDLGNSPLDTWEGAKNAIKNSKYACKEPTQEALKGIISDEIPVICIGSGPSATRFLPRIKEIQGRVVIIVADSSYAGCIAAGIVPDFVTLIERQQCMAKLVPAGLHPDPILVAPLIAHPDSVAGWEGRRVWALQNTAGLYEWLAPNGEFISCGRSAGTLSIALAGYLGSKRIYLVGHDLAYDDKASHSFIADPMAARNHSAALACPTDLMHKDEACSGQTGELLRTCHFWNLVRGDIANWCQESPAKVFNTGLSAIPGTHRAWAIPDGREELTLNWRVAYTSPVIDRSAFKHDIWYLVKKFSQYAHMSNEAKVNVSESGHVLRLLNPVNWSTKNNLPFLNHVLAVIYHAAGIRMRLRPDGFQAGIDIITRTVPAMLRRMEREL